MADNKEGDLVLESVDTSVDTNVADSDNNKDSEAKLATVESSDSSDNTVSSQAKSQEPDVVKEEAAGKPDTDTKTDKSQSTEPSSR